MRRSGCASFVWGALVLGWAPLVTAQEAPAAASAGASAYVYIGSYAREDEPGIHVCRLDLASGALTRTSGFAGLAHPSFQAWHPSGKYLYSVSEVEEYDGLPTGAVAALAVDPQSGHLTLLNRQSSMGAGPCYVAVDAPGRHVLAANYSSGSVVVLPIAADGRLEMACAFVQHQGSSVHQRQQGPHAHSIRVDPTGQFALAADLGLDQVLIYRYDDRSGSLTPNAWQAAATITPGAGPRHLAFHPNGRWCYVINELSSTVTVLEYHSETGRLDAVQEIATLPADFHGESTTADVAVSSDGRFLYGSNRGHDSIAVFAIDAESGRLTPVSHHATLGQMPRSFRIDPTGTWLLAANQRTNNVVVFRIDRASGKLQATGEQLELPRPVCVTFSAVRSGE